MFSFFKTKSSNKNYNECDEKIEGMYHICIQFSQKKHSFEFDVDGLGKLTDALDISKSDDICDFLLWSSLKNNGSGYLINIKNIKYITINQSVKRIEGDDKSGCTVFLAEKTFLIDNEEEIPGINNVFSSAASKASLIKLGDYYFSRSEVDLIVWK